MKNDELIDKIITIEERVIENYIKELFPSKVKLLLNQKFCL